ncbi:MAG: serine/threonine protein kinase [Lachnospiraceae bacterium]|nr:serine/threonine protein kinase [Lachnospiraceae bacterium]
MTKTGTTVAGRYEVIRPIGEGGTSRVYLVADKHIGRTLAMKVMDAQVYGALTFARSEIESLRCVSYPAFPAIHDAFVIDGRIHIVSEYVKGTLLWNICRGSGMKRDRALLLLQHISDALSYLHHLDRPILYLDLKPDNIIIDESGLPHLIDFGIAGWLAAKHIPVGTIGYSPPEQYRPDGDMDVTSDIFALGMTYYAIRAGVPPDKDTDAVLKSIGSSRIFNSSEKSFLKKCCAFDKTERYQDTREVSKRIRHIRSFPDRLRKKTVFVIIAAGLSVMACKVAKDLDQNAIQSKTAAELARAVTPHMEDGEYTPEGIRIIKTYISSGNLPSETEQEFIFEVAVNSMLVSHDYKCAQVYFSKLDRNKYPQMTDYLELCRMHTGFKYESDKALEITGRLFTQIVSEAPSKRKYENLIFIADCYELYGDKSTDGILKAISVLKIAKDEIAKLDDGSYGQLAKRIDEIKAVKERRLQIKRSEDKMIGETDE